MKVRLGIICTGIVDAGFWNPYIPQNQTIIHEVMVEIPELPPGWSVFRVMVLDPSEEMIEEEEDMTSKKLTHTMEVVCYEDADGNPTCAIDFNIGDVCIFYRTYGFGTRKTCVFAEENYRGKSQTMNRRKNGEGTLIPLDTCPIWSNRKSGTNQNT